MIPASLMDPPGVVAVLFDVNIPTAYTGTFADIGVTIFGHTTTTFGNQVQFADTVSLAALGAGQFNNQRIDLDTAVNYRPGESFNQIVQQSGGGPTDLVTDLRVSIFYQQECPQFRSLCTSITCAWSCRNRPRPVWLDSADWR